MYEIAGETVVCELLKVFQIRNKALVGSPVHTLGLDIVPIFPPKPPSDFVCPPLGALVSCLALRRVRQFVAMAARKNSPAVEHRNPPPASARWAGEPSTIAAIIAWLIKKAHRVVMALPFVVVAFASINQPDLAMLSLRVDACDLLAIY